MQGPWRDDPRAQTFDLRWNDGSVHRATLGLEQQQVDDAAAADPDLIHAVQCWLAARGARRVDLRTTTGRTLARGEFGPAELGDAPTLAVRRVVTLAPSNAELVAALDAFDRVVGCEDSSDWPPEVESCVRLGPDLAPDLEEVTRLAPELVISSLTVPGMERVVTGLRARGLCQVVCAPRSLADVIADLRRVGEHLGRGERAAAVIEHLHAEEAELVARRPAVPQRVYLEWWPRPMFTPGRDCYSNELIALAGGINVFGNRPGSSVEVHPADLMQAQPDVCFVSWCGVAEDKLDPRNLIERPGLESLQAAREGRVYVLDERYSGRPGPRMLEAARRMSAAMQVD